MNYIKTSILSIILLSTVSIVAQNKPNQVTNEITEKTLKIKKNGAVVENSVKISTEIRQAVMIAADDKGKINGDRIFPPKVVIKTVEIDNDDDQWYDEKIKFSYMTDERTDFTLVSENNNVMIAIEEGNNVSILENQKMFVPNENDKNAYIYTAEDGSQIEFQIEESWSKGTK
jgi:hypothetical protein